MNRGGGTVEIGPLFTAPFGDAYANSSPAEALSGWTCPVGFTADKPRGNRRSDAGGVGIFPAVAEAPDPPALPLRFRLAFGRCGRRRLGSRAAGRLWRCVAPARPSARIASRRRLRSRHRRPDALPPSPTPCSTPVRRLHFAPLPRLRVGRFRAGVQGGVDGLRPELGWGTRAPRVGPARSRRAARATVISSAAPCGLGVGPDWCKVHIRCTRFGLPGGAIGSGDHGGGPHPGLPD